MPTARSAPGALRAALLRVLEDGPATAQEAQLRLLAHGVERPLDALLHALRRAAGEGLVAQTRTARRGGWGPQLVWSLPAEVLPAEAGAPPPPPRRQQPDRSELMGTSIRVRMRPSELEIVDQLASDAGVDRSTMVRRLVAKALGWGQ